MEKESRARRLWSDEEVEFLMERWGAWDLKKLSSWMKRSEIAIARKAVKLKLGACYGGDGRVTCSQLVQALAPRNRTQRVIERLINNGLPVKKIRLRKRVIRVVELSAFWRWAETHQSLIDWASLEENLLGKEPEWVNERRKIDYDNYTHNRRNKFRFWTKIEDEHLRLLVADGKSMTVIAEKLNRSEQSVRRRCYDLYLPYPKNKAPREWTSEECNQAVLLKTKGYHVSHIARILKRSENSVSGKLRCLLKEC